jgi:hypothetical protein
VTRKPYLVGLSSVKNGGVGSWIWGVLSERGGTGVLMPLDSSSAPRTTSSSDGGVTRVAVFVELASDSKLSSLAASKRAECTESLSVLTVDCESERRARDTLV